jgi:hypothetical protein
VAVHQAHKRRYILACSQAGTFLSYDRLPKARQKCGWKAVSALLPTRVLADAPHRRDLSDAPHPRDPTSRFSARFSAADCRPLAGFFNSAIDESGSPRSKCKASEPCAQQKESEAALSTSSLIDKLVHRHFPEQSRLTVGTAFGEFGRLDSLRMRTDSHHMSVDSRRSKSV